MEVDFETHITADGTRKRKRDGELAGDQLVRETLELKDSSKVEKAKEVEKTEEVEVEEPGELEGADAIQVLQLLHDLKILKEAWEKRKGAGAREVEDFLRTENQPEDKVKALRECEKWWKKEKENQKARETSAINQRLRRAPGSRPSKPGGRLRLRRLEESLASVVAKLGVASIEEKDAAKRKEEEVKKRNREVEARRAAEKALAKAKALEEKDQAQRKKSEKDAQEAADREKQRLDIVQAAKIAADEADVELKRKELAVYDIKKKSSTAAEIKRAEEEVQEAATKASEARVAAEHAETGTTRAEGSSWQVVGTTKMRKWVMISLHKEVSAGTTEEAKQKQLEAANTALRALERGEKRRLFRVVGIKENAMVSRYERRWRIIEAPWAMEEAEVVRILQCQLEAVFGGDLLNVWAEQSGTVPLIAKGVPVEGLFNRRQLHEALAAENITTSGIFGARWPERLFAMAGSLDRSPYGPETGT
ncbi:hypothetical protein BDZ91DRAFT_847197 [Kalaharituber pfeilii]|nr:hypothetical protein BDZ91DRAFT_847197 [Kalaharituber pfeilii]